MTIGNLLNLGAYYFLKYVINGRDPEAFDAGAKPVSPFIMLPVIILLQTYRNKAKCLKVVIVQYDESRMRQMQFFDTFSSPMALWGTIKGQLHYLDCRPRA